MINETHKMAIENLRESLEDHGHDDITIEETVEAMEGLLKKGLIKVYRMESGEFYWKSTEEGNAIVKAYDSLQ